MNAFALRPGTNTPTQPSDSAALSSRTPTSTPVTTPTQPSTAVWSAHVASGLFNIYIQRYDIC